MSLKERCFLHLDCKAKDGTSKLQPFIMDFRWIEVNKLSENELIEKLQGTWECEDHPSHFRIEIKDQNIFVNNEKAQKLTLEKFDDSWSFYLHISIPGSITERMILDKVSVMTYRKRYSRITNFAFMEISPADAKTHKDLVIYDCRLLRFKNVG